MDQYRRIRGWTALLLLSFVLFVGGAPIGVAAVAEGEEGLSQVSTDATALTPFEKQALACRSSATAEALLAVGSATALDRQVLQLGTSPADDWCVYLKTRLVENGPQHIEGLNPGFGQCLTKFFQAGDAAGARLTIYSGYRTSERQAELFNEAVQKYGSVSAARVFVAPPPCSAGTDAVVCSDNGSKHQRGLAADLRFNGQGMPQAAAGIVACNANYACTWAHANASVFGLDFRIRDVEVWHIEPSGAGCQNEGQAAPNDAPRNPLDIRAIAGDSDTTVQNLIQRILTTAQQQVEQGMTSGLSGQSSGANDIVGNLFSTIANVFTQPIGPNATGNSTGATEYLVLSEDGTILAQSNLSAKDALTQASSYYNQEITATSSQGYVQFGGVTGNMIAPGNPFQLGERITAFLSGNTFSPVDPTEAASGGTSADGGNIIGTLVQSFIQQIFGLFGSLFGHGGR